MTKPGRSVVALLLVLAGTAACAGPAIPSPATPSPAVETPGPSIGPTATPAATTPPATSTPNPATPSPTPAPTPTPRATRPPPAAPSPGADTPLPDTFWGYVEEGIRRAGRLQLDIVRPDAATMRFEVRASATVIDGVIGLVCIGGKAYDGQSAFTAIPGRWTCGAPALVAGFRHIGQPIDAWSTAIPSDRSRHETVTVRGDTWTWTYRATSPYLGGTVTATVVLDRSSRRITSAHRQDPTGATRYAFHYGASFPPLAVPR